MRTFIKTSLYLLLIGGVLFFGGQVLSKNVVLPYVKAQLLRLPQIPEDLEAVTLQPGTRIYADSGELLYTFNRSRRKVRLDEVSRYFIDAVLATEDVNFYHHRGYNVKAILGAAYTNLRHRRNVRGGSTITQQIVKNLFLSTEKVYKRKIKEALLAAQLEAMFEERYGSGYKDRLLEWYINETFYGTAAYGVEDAAKTYFGKSAQDLNLLESALLAGLPNAPTQYNPLRNREDAERRLNHVLRRMYRAGYIDKRTFQTAMRTSVVLRPEIEVKNKTPYFVEAIKGEVAEKWGRSSLNFGGLNIYTTLDLKMQRIAEEVVSEQIHQLDRRLGFKPYYEMSDEEKKGYVQIALISLDPKTGYVKAMIGGRDIFTSYYNRAIMARRQPGSGFKPICYLAALDSKEVTPVSLFVDAPRTYLDNRKPWTPKNFKNQYLGLTTVALALVKSANSTSVQIVHQIGPKRVVEMGKRMGFKGLQENPSIALGTSEVTVQEMASAYGVLANYGIRMEPTLIKYITDIHGSKIYEHNPQATDVVSPQRAYEMIKLLENVIDYGTGRRVRALGFDRHAAGKTGTTNDNTDAWFTGFTPALATSVWIGFDERRGKRKLIDRRTRAQITGGSGAAPIWAAYMKRIVEGEPDVDFFVSDGVRLHTVDPKTGIPIDRFYRRDGLRHRPMQIALPKGEKPNTLEEVLAFQADQDTTLIDAVLMESLTKPSHVHKDSVTMQKTVVRR